MALLDDRGALDAFVDELVDADDDTIARFIIEHPGYTDIVEAAIERARNRHGARQRQLTARNPGLYVPGFYAPADWCAGCFKWSETSSRGLSGYQADVLNDLVEHGRMAVRGPHGLGKTTLSAQAVLWFACTRDAAGVDWKVPTTASVWRQLSKYLWPEIHKWVRLIDWQAVGRDPFTGRELLDMAIKLRTGEAFAVASDQPSAIEGAHADHMLYLFDEAKAIPDGTFDAAEGAFSTAGEGGTEAYALAVSTPGEPFGRFYAIHARQAGTEDWHTRHVTLDEAIAAKRVTRSWADARRRLWGPKSSIYLNRVEGEFAAGEAVGVIPLAWVEAANDRWRSVFDEQATPVDPAEGTARVVYADHPLTALGVDVAREGSDVSSVALGVGHGVLELRRYPYTSDTMELTGHVAGIQRGHGLPRAKVDVIGVGGGVVDRLREQELPVVAFSASESTERLDRTGELGFANKRSAAWWNLREMLDPAYDSQVLLPPDDRLTGDLVAPRWRVTSGNKIQVESKDDIRKRIGRSTDDGDAVVMLLWEEPPGQLAAFLEAWKTYNPATAAKPGPKMLQTDDAPAGGDHVHKWEQGRCVYCGLPRR